VENGSNGRFQLDLLNRWKIKIMIGKGFAGKAKWVIREIKSSGLFLKSNFL
jgi:hypothetical protein